MCSKCHLCFLESFLNNLIIISKKCICYHTIIFTGYNTIIQLFHNIFFIVGFSVRFIIYHTYNRLCCLQNCLLRIHSTAFKPLGISAAIESFMMRNCNIYNIL